AGWFAARLGADTAAARRTASGEVTVARGRNGSRRAGAGDAGDVLAVRFVRVGRADVAPGAGVRVDLATDDGARVEIAREDDPWVVGWQGECGGVVIPHAVTLIETPDETALLERQLAGPPRDRLFESSLAAAAGLAVALDGRG